MAEKSGFALRVDGGLILPGMPEDAAMAEDGWEENRGIPVEICREMIYSNHGA